MTARCTGLKLLIIVLTYCACSSMLTIPAGCFYPSVAGGCPRAGDSYHFQGATISEQPCSSPCSGKYMTAARCTASLKWLIIVLTFACSRPSGDTGGFKASCCQHQEEGCSCQDQEGQAQEEDCCCQAPKPFSCRRKESQARS